MPANGISQEEEMKNPYYLKYEKEKKNIRKRYSDNMLYDYSGQHLTYTQEERKEWLSWMKELGDLIFQPEGNYQKWTWEIMSEFDKLQMERRCTSKKSTQI